MNKLNIKSYARTNRDFYAMHIVLRDPYFDFNSCMYIFADQFYVGYS